VTDDGELRVYGSWPGLRPRRIVTWEL
jgi:hypothetical protein